VGWKKGKLGGLQPQQEKCRWETPQAGGKRRNRGFDPTRRKSVRGKKKKGIDNVVLGVQAGVRRGKRPETSTKKKVVVKHQTCCSRDEERNGV